MQGTTHFGWDLPPGCGTLPGEEMLPPCCEECDDEENNPDCMLTCEKYKEFMKESDAADEAMYDSYSESRFTHEDYMGLKQRE